MVDNTPLRYSANLHDVDWTNIVDQVLPNMNGHRKNILLHACGRYSINPVLLLSKMAQDEQYISHTMKSDEEFSSSIKSFANDLSRCGQEFDTTDSKIESYPLEIFLRRAFENDDKLVDDFLRICYTISQRYDIPEKTRKDHTLDQHNTFKRHETSEDNKVTTSKPNITLALPYPNTECWMLGASHFGALDTADDALAKNIFSSIDMAPSLFQRWGVPFDYLFSEGDVLSAHSGHTKKHSECSIEVKHATCDTCNPSGYSTYYSHLVLNDLKDGTFIEPGVHIGKIELDPEKSLCKCDWAYSSFQCATGPHLHLEMRYNGAPESLDGKVISNLRIKTGMLAHDQLCSDPEDCTKATIGGEPCSTTYTDVSTLKVTCPVTKGSNIGKIYVFGFRKLTYIICISI